MNWTEKCNYTTTWASIFGDTSFQKDSENAQFTALTVLQTLVYGEFWFIPK